MSLNAPDGVEHGQTATVSLAFEAAAETEETTGLPMTGTFGAPGGASASLSVQAIDRPAEPAEENDDADVQAREQESPGPMLGILAAVCFLVAAAARRR